MRIYNLYLAGLGIALATMFSFSGASYAACSSPAGATGDQVYNSTHSVMQFCDGTDWQSMKGGGTLASMSCAVSEIAQWDGTNWVCTSDPSGSGGDNLGNHTATTNLNMAANHLINAAAITTGNWHATYDAWLQGGVSGATGGARNLALLGNKSTDTLYLNFNNEYAGGTVIGSTNTTVNALTGSGVIQSNASLRAPIFYDTNNTGYYVDPASTSILNVVRATSLDILSLPACTGASQAIKFSGTAFYCGTVSHSHPYASVGHTHGGGGGGGGGDLDEALSDLAHTLSNKTEIIILIKENRAKGLLY